ncbi:MAG: nitronate monooxygenase [Steroidobacteraceae bacterium]
MELPLIQAPMAGVQGSALPLAVAQAGALGSLPCALLSMEQMRSELTAISAATQRPFNVNFFCHTPPAPDAARESTWRAALQPYYAELGVMDANSAPPPRRPFDASAAEVLEAFRPAVVSFHFGLPSTGLLQRVRARGAKIVSSATTVAEALWLEARGVDAIIAQGLEAGGHRGHFLSDDLSEQCGTFALLPQIVRAVRVPVIAAGGIVDRASVAAAFALGAAGVQIGTAYLLCEESMTSAVHRAVLTSEASQHTALTNLFTGRAARGIVNRLMRDLGSWSQLAPEFPLAAGPLAPLRAHAEAAGRGDFSPLWAGQNVTGCKKMPAGELTRELMQLT